MDACNRRELDGAVNVRDIERALADRAAWPRPAALVGRRSGGGGRLRARRGSPPPTTWRDSAIRVTVFEAGAELGGLLRTGIPEYRLPRDVLDREIDFILAHGVEVRTGHRVDRAGLGELRASTPPWSWRPGCRACAPSTSSARRPASSSRASTSSPRRARRART